ncbi:uncharacterized protein TRIADDRAFT_60644 [Trichoplax adhaerens]|uniref:Cyclic AMP-dependent transcription factor ATF-2 n=1 Tax=Trichoplax adhaerens TaxID=10228 RepID=B3S8S4_TRIAD|nr:hypothetical protein TRIADDRAFT_60644 [Trichoplax adhaerens]EDV21003.1 hypothetical protein TRIADDRAFT_60644 [Trichoplax adhaerens]|eukprot:XP_002116647.1 hypothetical protein TRIADDRAFT_60644 [Trichoplax adhaerens]
MSEVDDKPFQCPIEGCKESFTNMDHLEVHQKRHTSNLKIQCANRASSDTPASALPDQTPTPSRFLRAFEEAGLEDALQNPFEATFAKAAVDRADPSAAIASGVLATMKLRDSSQHDVAAALTSLSQQPSPVPISPTSIATLLPSKSTIKPVIESIGNTTSASTATVVANPIATTATQQSISHSIPTITKTVTAQLSQQPVNNGALNSITVVSAKERLQHSLRVKAIKTSASTASSKTPQVTKTKTLDIVNKVTKAPTAVVKAVSTNDTPVRKSEAVTNGPHRTKRARRSQEDLDPEEKRQRFLERNRAAATRCREKKKTWISGLDKKVKELSDKNSSLQAEAAKLRSEVAHLKSLLIAYQNGSIAPRKEHLSDSVSDAETVASSVLTHLAMAPSTDITSNGGAKITASTVVLDN